MRALRPLTTAVLTLCASGCTGTDVGNPVVDVELTEAGANSLHARVLDPALA